MNVDNDIYDAYFRLAGAICKKAMYDLKMALLRKDITAASAIERWFTNGSGYILSLGQGDYLIGIVKKEIAQMRQKATLKK